MQVYVLFDNEGKIIDIYSHAQDAINETIKHQGIKVETHKVITKDTEMKSITTVDEKVYDAKHMDSIMPFGKYKGKTVGEIIEDDADYMRWCVNNLNFSIDEECLDFLDEMLTQLKQKRR